MNILDFEIGSIVRFKNRLPLKDEYFYGIVVDRSIISGEFWIKWLNHVYVNCDDTYKYDINETYIDLWSIVS